MHSKLTHLQLSINVNACRFAVFSDFWAELGLEWGGWGCLLSGSQKCPPSTCTNWQGSLSLHFTSCTPHSFPPSSALLLRTGCWALDLKKHLRMGLGYELQRQPLSALPCQSLNLTAEPGSWGEYTDQHRAPLNSHSSCCSEQSRSPEMLRGPSEQAGPCEQSHNQGNPRNHWVVMSSLTTGGRCSTAIKK